MEGRRRLSPPDAARREENAGGSRSFNLYSTTYAEFAIGVETGVETGQNSRGVDENRTNSWCVHVRGLQRGWRLIENGNHLGQLAMTAPDRCILDVGAFQHVRDGGGPARIIAIRGR